MTNHPIEDALPSLPFGIISRACCNIDTAHAICDSVRFPVSTEKAQLRDVIVHRKSIHHKKMILLKFALVVASEVW